MTERVFKVVVGCDHKYYPRPDVLDINSAITGHLFNYFGVYHDVFVTEESE